MKGILADANIQGQVDWLVVLMQAEPWKLFWDHLGLRYPRFVDVGLVADSPDDLVWETCQREELVLITDNRTRKTPDSLEATIGSRNTPSKPASRHNSQDRTSSPQSKVRRPYHQWNSRHVASHRHAAGHRANLCSMSPVF